jgi:cytochrome P450
MDPLIFHARSPQSTRRPRLSALWDFLFLTPECAAYSPPHSATQSLPIVAVSPKLTFFFTSLTSKYRSSHKILNGFLKRKIREGRARAVERGQDKAESVDCVLDLICLKESGSDRLDDESMRDELHQFLIAGQETT